MPGFKEALAAILATEGAVFPEDMESTLTSAYDDDFGVSAGAIEALNTTNGELNEQIAGLKIRLHDYMAAEATAAANSTDDADPADNDIEQDAEDADFDGLFTNEKED